MSYLNLPRLVFAGQFQADVSTVNNDPEHFNTSRFRSNYQLPGSGASNGWWNPNGTGSWRFRNCLVTSVVYRDGSSCSDPHLDPVIGLSVNGSDHRVEGKLVDLDSEQQMVSEIWGFSINLGSAESGLGFHSRFAVAPFADIWVCYPAGQPDSFFSAYYQSVLEQVKLIGAGKSRFLNELLGGAQPPDQFSIKFNVDGFDDTMSSPNFTFGRVVGSIGLRQAGEPRHVVPGRRLFAVPGQTANDAIGQIVGNVLTLDLGNSLPTASVGGPRADSGSLTVALLPNDGPPQLLGEVNYQTPAWYESTAGIVTINLSDSQLSAAANTPLGLIQNGSQPLLAENPNGQWVRADQFVFRFNPPESTTVKLYASSFGQPLANAQISLNFDSSAMAGQTTQGPAPGPQVVGVPQSALSFSTSITTGSDGVAELNLKSADPGNPRGYIDGQVYGVTYQLGSTPPPQGSVQNGAFSLNALVFSGYTIPDTPDWMSDVRPIFQQYADLYPIMHKIVDLSNYASLSNKIFALKNVFKAPVSDPNYMPVTRDLSTKKREMLLKWLDNPLYMELDSVGDLHLALQQAIELEHSTIPPYLTALYSIKPGANIEVAQLIRSVVMEEMLHMALVSNLMISIGGKPSFNRPKFVPVYPGSLPGGLRADLNVRLRKCSIDQLRAFMSIEQPEKTIETVHYRARRGDPVDTSRFTIGWFYDEIKVALTNLSNAGQISFGNADKQVTQWHGKGKLFAITSLEDACRAIDEIKRQGEGANPRHPGDGDHELSHYYKYAEIVNGRRLVKKGEGFAYDGEVIPFDPSGVWPMMDDPNLAVYPKGSRARILQEQFARTYQALLNGLHIAFNDEPDKLGQAVGLMFSLQLAAQQLMETPSGLNDGTTAGPAFQMPFPY
ncbi:ferritin-like protein [Undibacterium sp. TS12]|uniref:ferritin-like domain-containing protein n=1 Tax=Undibacterium sp. TS12 TaxID=2908202 RepID=UPI001F4C76D0|nr:ferritin-like protein [Undibacterium sp. TS12]MCH8617575.1 ferritin-like protein [Undibacterium sp. TS12]